MEATTMRELYVIMAALFLIGAPAVTASEDGDPPDAATWGLCVAEDNSDQGDEASNGTVSNTPPFSNTSEEECENATHPANGTPGEDHAPEDPGQPDDPGNETPGDDYGPEDPGQPEDPGNGGGEDDNRNDDGNGEDDDHRP